LPAIVPSATFTIVVSMIAMMTPSITVMVMSISRVERDAAAFCLFDWLTC